MEKTVSNKRFEKKFNIWLYTGALYISYLAGTFFESGMTINSLISQINLIFSPVYGYLPYFVVIMLRVFLPLLYVGLFELVSRLFYMFANTISLGAITMKGGDFVAALRLFMILNNFALGILNLLYYFFNFLIPLGMILISFLITTAAYFLFFLYINKYYLDPKTAHRAFRAMALIYLGFNFINLMWGIII